MDDYVEVLADFELWARKAHEHYWREIDGAKLSGEVAIRAAQWSRIAAAYEGCHARLARAMGVDSPYHENYSD